jgi:hypothetical protein
VEISGLKRKKNGQQNEQSKMKTYKRFGVAKATPGGVRASAGRQWK